jgi:formate--tetrahydrofolate ligase
VTQRAYATHGIDNIKKHIESIGLFRVPVVVSINIFVHDSQKDIDDLRKQCQDLGVEVVITDFRELGGEGGLQLAERVCTLCEKDPEFRFLYDLDLSIREKVETIATKIYGASEVDFSSEASKQIKQIENLGYATLPVCIAKTPVSLTDDPKIPGGPKQKFTIHVNSARVSAGAGFVVIYTGAILTMPGLPKQPAALNIDIDEFGNISGLF